MWMSWRSRCRKSSGRPSVMFWRVFGVVVVVALAATAPAQETTPGRSGGLLPKAGAGLSRDELVRSWDLDRNGTISQSESEIVRARLQRKVRDIQMGSGLDPVTGRPRGVEPSTDMADGDDESSYRLPPEPTQAPKPSPNASRTGEPRAITRPKSLAELVAPPDSVRSLPGGSGDPTSGSATPPVNRSSRASWLPPAPKATTGVGGPRAGAPAAVPGYGAGGRSDLNAGRSRPIEPRDQSAAAGAGRAPAGGQRLSPTTLPPGRTGAVILPGQASLKLAPLVPTSPSPPRYSPPRVSAEDIGGYRP